MKAYQFIILFLTGSLVSFSAISAENNKQGESKLIRGNPMEAHINYIKPSNDPYVTLSLTCEEGNKIVTKTDIDNQTSLVLYYTDSDVSYICGSSDAPLRLILSTEDGLESHCTDGAILETGEWYNKNTVEMQFDKNELSLSCKAADS